MSSEFERALPLGADGQSPHPPSSPTRHLRVEVAEELSGLTPGSSLAELVAAYEKHLIELALQATRGNRSKAAKLLRTTERIIGYRVQQYDIDCRVFRD